MIPKIAIDKVKFIFIDFDGTLVDTVPLLFENYSRFLKKYGKNGTLEEFGALMGPAIEEFIPILMEKHQLPKNPNELLHAYMEGLSERYKQDAKLMKGAEQFLVYIKERGLKMALVTSSSYELIKGSLENLKLQAYFDYIITGEKVKKTKPDPEIYLLALKTCGANLQNTFAIEDSTNGVLASLGAHIPTIALKNDHLKNIPNEVILVKDWDDLLTLLRNQYGE